MKKVRTAKNRVPSLFLNAPGEAKERVRRLRARTDGDLAKPLAFSGLPARIEALAKRSSEHEETSNLDVGGSIFYRSGRGVTHGGEAIVLMPRAYRLLEHPMRHSWQVATRTMRLKGVRDHSFGPWRNVINMHFSRLRQRIDRGFDRSLICAVHGAGYVLREKKA